MAPIGLESPDSPLLDATIGPAPTLLESAARGELPGDVLQAGLRRLLLLTAVCSLTLSGILALSWMMASSHPTLAHEVLPHATRTLLPALALNVLMFAAARGLKRKPSLVLSASLAYLVLFCLALSVLRHGSPWPSTEVLRSWSPVAVILVTYGALVPTRPSRILMAGTLAALMDPFALYLTQPEGSRPDAEQLALLLLSPASGVGLAYLSSRLLYGLTEHISKAREVGSYSLQRRLGIGGMGEVWEAKHQMLARPAAIKLIRPAILAAHGPEESRRLLRLFEKEAQVTARLTSPHTIQLYDYGVTLDGTFYYVMELLDGYDLQTLVERYGRQTPERVAHLLIQATDSLDEAHQHDLVHRDLKPANIFTCRHGGQSDFAKILDFGLVMDRRPTAEELEKKKLIGTPAVMAPEMVRFNAPVSHTADIYALGCVAYWMLTAERVFEAESRADMLVMHAHQRPIAPSRRAGVWIPEALERLILQCLDKNPKRRPQSARLLGEKLREIGVHRQWTRERRDAWWQAHGQTPDVPAQRREPSDSLRLDTFPPPEIK